MRRGPAPQVFPEALEAHRRAFIAGLEARHYARSSVAAYAEVVAFFFRFLLSRDIEAVADVTRETMRQYQLELGRGGRAVRGVHAKLIPVRRFFEHLEKADTILINPCDGMKLPKLDEKLPRRILSLDEARRVFAAVETQTPKGIRDRAILEVFYSTGIRLEEMTRLSVLDVDLSQGFLRVNKGKGSRDRVVPLGRKASAYVKEYLHKVRAEWSRADREERALWLGSNAPHRPMGKMAVTVMLKEYGWKAGIDQSVSPHVWRHTCATHLMLHGASIAHVQRLLGHRSLNTTQIYTRATIRDVVDAWRKGHPRARGGRAPSRNRYGVAGTP